MKGSTLTDQATASHVSRRIDVGRVVMIPLSAGILYVNARVLVDTLTQPMGFTMLARTLGILLALAFYAMIVFAYLRRSRASATSRSVLAALAALAATALPFAFPLLTSPRDRLLFVALGDALLLAGLAWSVWSLRTLDRSLSVLAQARTLVSHGPYRLVRHPLYLGELVAALGIVLLGFTLKAAVAWLFLVGLQAFRASKEEALLSSHVPGYAEYRSRTSLIIPGIV